MKSFSHVRLFAIPWTVVYQASLSMGFPRQVYWSGLPFPSPGDLPDPGIKPRSPALQADVLTSEPGRAWLSTCAASCGRLGWPPSHHGHTRFRVTESASWGGSPLSGYGSCACLVAQSCLILCDPTDCSPPGSSVHGISQARILEWVAISFPRGSSPPRN